MSFTLVIKFAVITLLRYVSAFAQLLVPGKGQSIGSYIVSRIGMFIVAALFCFLQLVNVLFLLLDEIVFSSYRKVTIDKPVFILGAPRSGTTTTHRELSSHSNFTSVSLWECLFAPSILQRKIIAWLCSLDKIVGGPLRKTIAFIELKAFPAISQEHKFGLLEPEEDFLLLLPVLHCFLLTVPCPRSEWLWRFSTADRQDANPLTDIVFAWHKRCIQRHLFCHPGKRYLAKNPSFSGIAYRLTLEFPDCKIIVCERDAPTAIQSQLRVLSPIHEIINGSNDNPVFEERLLRTLRFYYRNLEKLQDCLSVDRVIAITLWDISKEPRKTFNRLHRWLGQPSADYADRLINSSDKVKREVDYTDTSTASRLVHTPGSEACSSALQPVAPKTSVYNGLDVVDNAKFADFERWRCPEGIRL